MGLMAREGLRFLRSFFLRRRTIEKRFRVDSSVSAILGAKLLSGAEFRLLGHNPRNLRLMYSL